MTNGFDSVALSGPGSIVVGAVNVLGPVFRLALPGGNSGTISVANVTSSALPPALETSSTPGAGNTVVMVWVGGGNVTAQLSGQQLAVFETTNNATGLFSGSVFNPATGTASSNPTIAAGAAGQGFATPYPQPTYRPSAKLEFENCPISSVNCHIVSLVQLPPLVALPAYVPIEAAPLDDFDLLLPGIADQED